MPHSWTDFLTNLLTFGNGTGAISLLEKVVRPMIVYAVLVFALRGTGRRILAQLNPFDLVVLLILSNTVQNAIIGNDSSLLGGLIGGLVLLGFNRVLTRIYYRGPQAERTTVEGQDIYLIRNYELQEPALEKLHVNRGELIAKAHERGFDDLSRIQNAVLYPNGTIYFQSPLDNEGRTLNEILTRLTSVQQELAALRRA